MHHSGGNGLSPSSLGALPSGPHLNLAHRTLTRPRTNVNHVGLSCCHANTPDNTGKHREQEPQRLNGKLRDCLET